MDTGAMEALLKAWRDSSNAEALGELLKIQRDRAYSVALRLTGSESDAEDVVQQAFLKLLSRTSGFEDLESFEQSVFRAIVQCGLDSIRQRKRQVTREARAGEQVNVAYSAEQTQEQQEVLTLLRSAVQELPEDERAPVVLCYYQGLSTASAARTLELPRETIRARLARAMESLRAALRKSNKDDRAALILPLLWQDGTVAAPASLCNTLDKILPGKACAQIPALKPAGPPAPLPMPSAPAISIFGTAAAVAIVAIAGAVFMASKPSLPPPPMPTTTSVNLNENHAPAAIQSAPKTPGQSFAEKPGVEVELVSEKPFVPKTPTPATPPAVSATQPNDDAARAIAEIAARRAVKERAAAKTAAAQREWKGAWGEGQPGAPIMIQIPEGQPGAQFIIEEAPRQKRNPETRPLRPGAGQ